MTLVAVFAFAVSSMQASGSTERPDRIIVSAAVKSPSVVSWQVSVGSDGSLRGKIKDGETDVPFSVKQLPEATLQRIRVLANCVVAMPSVDLGGCPIIDSLHWPPTATLDVRVGARVRKSSGCIEQLELGVGTEGRPTLELLIELQRMLPASRSYDLRPKVLPVLERLRPSVTCLASSAESQ